MKQLLSRGPNAHEAHRGNGRIELYSYDTFVALFIPDTGVYCTTTKHSVTTSKHVNAFVAAHTDVPRVNVSDNELELISDK